jgi:non-specific protein-tyrosine kinase
MMVDQRSPAAEAYRTLRTVLQNRFFNRGNKTLLITSTTPQEGKTTTTVNLALACADAGLATVLVGGNLRHPVLGKYFAIDRATGLHEVLSGQLDVESALQPTGHTNLSILNSGGFSRRPAELLASKRFDDTLAYLKTKFEIIIVDSPPALPVADAATIAPKVDGVLIVYLVSVAPRDALIRCKETMDEVGANIVGVVFNDIRGATQADYSGYYYYHKYAGDEFSRL